MLPAVYYAIPVIVTLVPFCVRLSSCWAATMSSVLLVPLPESECMDRAAVAASSQIASYRGAACFVHEVYAANGGDVAAT